jgi:hypothetical protein
MPLRFSRKLPADLEYTKVPGFGLAYLDHLIGELETLKGGATGSGDANSGKPALALAESIVEQRHDGEKPITWGQVYALEKSLLQMQTPDELRARAWSIEARYQDAIGDAGAYKAYVKSIGGDPQAETEPVLRARVEGLLGELYRLYTVSSCREDLRRRLSKRVSISVIAVATILTLFAALNPLGLWTINMVVVSGALGGFVSFERRIQSLPSRGESLGDLVELSMGSGMYLAPISGGIFAAVLYMLFTGGLLEGSLFPKDCVHQGD